MLHRIRQERSLWQHMFAWLLTLALGMGLLPAEALRQALADDGGTQPVEGLEVEDPRVKPDSSMTAGQNVTWDCIWLGSYPQSEVTLQDTPALEQALWDENGDATINGVKYRRLTRGDITNSNNWPQDAGEYRYFRYDPIKWRVLSVNEEENTAFCLADVGLDCQRFQNKNDDVTWETSSIRAWLNGSSANSPKAFINRAFSSSEQTAILKSTIKNPPNILSETFGGNTTEDHIFLLAEYEVYGDSTVGSPTSYGFTANGFTYDEARRCTATSFAHAMGAKITDGNCCEWWLRSHGFAVNRACYMLDRGSVSSGGTHVDNDYLAVRPAMNLDLTSSHLTYAGTVASNGEVEELVNISSAEVKCEESFYYNGKPFKPKPTVTLGETVLTEDEDYTLSYENNIECGTATIIVSGIGAYSGTARAHFTIKENPYIVSDPKIEPDETMAAGQQVTWDAIWLGSYPQSEVTAQEIPELKEASWDDNGDTTIEGVKYRRITRGDAIYSSHWPADAGYYRYFRYDPIKWRVLGVDYEKGTAFCLADVALDSQRYNNNWAKITWETSSIRAWLNGSSEDNSKSFINIAFTEAERAAIIKTIVENKNIVRPNGSINGGNNTEDHIFFLSVSEVCGDATVGSATSFGFASYYDTLDEARRCTATSFADAMGAKTYTSNEFGVNRCNWWLRSPDKYPYYVGFMNHNGYVAYGGDSADSMKLAVRPALNLDLTSSQLCYAGTVASSGTVDEIPYVAPIPDPIDISSAELQIQSTYIYTGKAIEPKPTVKLGELVLTEGVDYELSYENNIEVGENSATVIVSGIGSYEGTVSANFTIAAVDLSSAEVQLKTRHAYTGKAIEPKPTVKLGELLLTEGVDYELSYENNIEIGENSATVIVSGIGSYKGKVSANFTIAENPYIVSDPTIEADETMAAGQKVTWDTLWFGSYPQSEVTLEGVPELEQASWDETTGDASIEGTKYRRITRGDATFRGYWPNDAGEYRYFRYEPIKWRVLSVDNEKGTAFCLADVALDCQGYHKGGAEVTWETSLIRAWLNGSSANSSKSFINSAFSESEQTAILKSTIDNLPNLEYGTPGGNDTEDHIFLLSDSEAYGNSATSYGFVSSYGTYDEARRCTATSFAHAMGAWINPSEELGVDRCDWWLRTPGNSEFTVSNVSSSGNLNLQDFGADGWLAVRPALKLDLTSSHLTYAGTVASKDEVDTRVDLSAAEVSVSDSFTYTGQPHKPEPTVTLDGQTLTPNVDYEWSYENNTDAGTATIIVVGTGENYSGKATGGFTIEPATLSNLTLSTTKYTYDGKAKIPTARIYAGKDLLVPSEGFELQYKNNVNPGLATVVAKGTGNYTGTIEKSFLISHKDPCFTDVSHKIINGKAEHWFADVVHRAKDLGLVQGTGDGKQYNPYGKITRADITVILWRMSGAPRNFEYTGFKDVKKYMSDGKTLNYYWYAIGWAKLNGVVDGKGEKKEYFAPTDNIKREDFAAILYKYVRNYKNRTKEVGNPAAYKHMKDASKVNGEVGNAVGWCYKQGVMTGSNGYLNPKGTATRAEAAKMILFVYDFLNK